MRRLFAVIGLLAGLGGCDGPAPLPPPSAGPAPGSNLPVAAALGSGGCAARGCHGGSPYADDGSFVPKWENAYAIWSRFDRHASAFTVLGSELGTGIIAKMQASQPNGGWRDARREPRCLGCHATPALANAQGVESLLAEGVSCDACHTQPGRSTGDWFVDHRDRDKLAACYAKKGMQWLGEPRARAEVCAGCHVGAPGREVTHDLIAAGHPRLMFEFVTFLDLLPPHWRERNRKPDGTTGEMPADAPLTTWLAGQVECARAGLALMADRAARAQSSSTPWPELAEWNCFACHRDVSAAPPSNRPQLATNPGNVSDPLARLLARDAAFTADLQRLRDLSESTSRASAGQMVGPANALRDRLAAWKPPPPSDILAGIGTPSANWDDAAQTYYALRAADRCPPVGRRAAALDRLAEWLRLPRSPAVINSPRGYDPARAAKAFAEAK